LINLLKNIIQMIKSKIFGFYVHFMKKINMKKMKKSSVFLTCIIFLILIITNPSNKNYKEYIYSTINVAGKIENYGRYRNFIIFSTFKSKTLIRYENKVRVKFEKHFGIFKNFYRMDFYWKEFNNDSQSRIFSKNLNEKENTSKRKNTRNFRRDFSRDFER
jgi:hypothetical protein